MDSESANESNISEVNETWIQYLLHTLTNILILLKSHLQSIFQNYSNSNQLSEGHLTNAANMSIHQIGKTAPHWVPDNVTNFCMQCNQKFSFIKRRHHCRACGLVLCSACCSLKAKLEYLGDVEARICIQCDMLLNQNSDSNRVSNALSMSSNVQMKQTVYLIHFNRMLTVSIQMMDHLEWTELL